MKLFKRISIVLVYAFSCQSHGKDYTSFSCNRVEKRLESEKELTSSDLQNLNEILNSESKLSSVLEHWRDLSSSQRLYLATNVLKKTPTYEDKALDILEEESINGSLSALGFWGAYLLKKEPSDPKALTLLDCAANRGNTGASTLLGEYYEFSLGNDLKKAFNYYKKGANVGARGFESGSPIAQYRLAMLFFNGNVGEQDLGLALTLFIASSNAGVLQAKFMYAYMLETGVGGSEPNLDKALELYLESNDTEWRRGIVEAARVLLIKGKKAEALQILNIESQKNTPAGERAREILNEYRIKNNIKSPRNLE